MKISHWITMGLSGLAIAACGPSGNAGNPSGSGDTAVAGTVLGDVVMGPEDASVTIIEYASITCPHCADFHVEVGPVLKERAEAGDIKFIFREFPTPPIDIAMAGFAIARCAGEDKYYDVLDDFFTNQDNLIQAARTGTVGDMLRAVGARHGVDATEFSACTRDDELYNSMIATVEGGQAMGVSSTPTIFLNGERLGREAQFAEGMSALIDAALGIEPAAEEEAPAEEEAESEAPAESVEDAETTAEAPAPVE